MRGEEIEKKLEACRGWFMRFKEHLGKCDVEVALKYTEDLTEIAAAIGYIKLQI